MSRPHDRAREKTVVVIEVKGCWNPELKVSMETQLVNRYLRDNFYTHGIYVSGGFTARSGRRRTLKGIAERCWFRLSKSARHKTTLQISPRRCQKTGFVFGALC